MFAIALIVLATGYALLRLLDATADTQVTVMAALFAVSVTAITYAVVERGPARRACEASDAPGLTAAGRG